MSKNENIHRPRFTITSKANSCPGCGFLKLACRCGGGGGGSEDTETSSQDLASKENTTSSTLFIKLEHQADLTPQLERKHLLSAQAVFVQFKQELKSQKIDVNEYAAAIIDNELQVKIHAPDHRDAFIQRLNNNPLAAQNESANKENNDEASANNHFSIPNPYALPRYTRD